MFQSSVARLTLFGALVVGGLLLLERVTEPAPEREARERPPRGHRPDAGTHPVARAPGGPAGSTHPLDGSLRDRPAGFFYLT